MPSKKERPATPTIRDVAQTAGVSPATVSRVLNNYAFIRPEVRAKVLSAIRTLGYEPNRVAQRLRSTRSLIIGFIVTDITNPFLNTVMSTVESIFFEHGYSVLMSNTGANAQKELDYLSMMEAEEAAGIVVIPTSEDVDRIAEMAAGGMPIVVIDRHMVTDTIDCVLSDNVAGAFSAVDHLIRLGHRQIGHIGGPLYLTSGRERYQGYLQAMAAAGLPVYDTWVRFGNHKYESGYQQTVELTRDHPEVTALFIENNMMSLGALTALQDLRRRVPDDVAVVGFDDTPWSTLLNPPLSVVAQSTAEIGRRAAALLLERIKQPDLPARTELLPTTLIVRASCGAKRPLEMVEPKGGPGVDQNTVQ